MNLQEMASTTDKLITENILRPPLSENVIMGAAMLFSSEQSRDQLADKFTFGFDLPEL